MSLLYVFILGIMRWKLVSESSSIRGFQGIKGRLPKLFNKNFVFKKAEFQ